MTIYRIKVVVEVECNTLPDKDVLLIECKDIARILTDSNPEISGWRLLPIEVVE